MQRTLCLLLTLGLATTALLPSLEAHEEDATMDVKLYLNRDPSGALTLTSLAPSARNSTTWTMSGWYYTSQGLDLRLVLQDPNPNWVIDEERGVTGWVTYGFKQTRNTGLLSPLQGYNYGTFSWTMEQGERSSRMTYQCAEYNETYEYQCDRYHYASAFPGHGAEPTPHTHGNGTDESRGLMSGDLAWVLAYKIPPCNSMSTSCFLGGQQMKYEFSILLDGTTFLQYTAIDEEHPITAPADETAGDNETLEDGNETVDPEDPQDGSGGNETGNQTGSGGEGSAYQPRPYSAQDAGGTVPGASLGAILATFGVAGYLVRRRRD